MATLPEQRQPAAEADLIGTLAGTNASAELRLTQKTRRLVHCALANMSQRKSRKKHSLALAIAAVVATLVVLFPMIWNALEHLISEEHFGDVQTQMALMLLFAVPALLAALLLMGKTLRGSGHGRRPL